MSESMNLNVRISGGLKDHVTSEINDGAYENISEYVRDLIRRDKMKLDQEKFETLKAELNLARATPTENYRFVSANDIKNIVLKNKSNMAT